MTTGETVDSRRVLGLCDMPCWSACRSSSWISTSHDRFPEREWWRITIFSNTGDIFLATLFCFSSISAVQNHESENQRIWLVNYAGKFLMIRTPSYSSQPVAVGLETASLGRTLDLDKVSLDTNVPPASSPKLICSNRPFATNDHMVQNSPCWRASSLLFPQWDIKIKRPPPSSLTGLCFNVPVRE